MDWTTDGLDWPWHTHSRFVDAAGLRWHVQAWPPKAPGARRRPLALLLHGTGASTHSFRHLAPRLATHFDVLAPDLPGHAFTSAPEDHPVTLPAVAQGVAGLLRHEGRTPALVVGHSAGAAVAVQMVVAEGLRPRLVVSLAGALLPPHGPAGALFLPLARALASRRWVPHAFAAWASWPPVLRQLLGSTGSTLDREGQRLYGRLVSDPAHAAGALRLMASWDLGGMAAALATLPVPLQLITASGDLTLPPAQAWQAAARCPRAHCVELEGLGHLAHEEAPERVEAEILAAWRLHRGAGRKAGSVSKCHVDESLATVNSS